MDRKAIIWLAVVLIVFLAATHPHTAGQVADHGYADVHQAAQALAKYAQSKKG